MPGKLAQLSQPQLAQLSAWSQPTFFSLPVVHTLTSRWHSIKLFPSLFLYLILSWSEMLMAALNFTQSSFQSLFSLSLRSPCLRHAITHIFASPDYLPLMHAHAKLPFFIVYALHQMKKLHQSVMFPSLILFQRLKAHFPSALGSSSHWLFISAFMIST